MPWGCLAESGARKGWTADAFRPRKTVQASPPTVQWTANACAVRQGSDTPLSSVSRVHLRASGPCVWRCMPVARRVALQCKTAKFVIRPHHTAFLPPAWRLSLFELGHDHEQDSAQNIPQSTRKQRAAPQELQDGQHFSLLVVRNRF